jgi:hypothetical protein
MYILCNRIFNQTTPKVTKYGFGNMSNSVYKVFAEIESKAKLLAQYWDNFHTEISQHLPESYQPEIQELSDKLETALTQLVYELQNPTLTLATTGTTSSGKSTLVNLLCGAEIVPVAVSEMSAGAVTIEYNTEKSLIIHETPGALWECGEWRGISDDKIYQRLYQAMIGYIETTPDSIVSVGLDLFGKRKLASQLRQSTRRAIQSEKISLRQPYMDVKDYIDQVILEGDKLKLQAEQYLSI